MIYRLESIEVRPQQRQILSSGKIIHVEPRVFDVLLYLLEHRHQVVSKDDLLDKVWGTRHVSESALTTSIKSIRRALGDNGQEQRIVKTVHGRGFRVVAEVVVESEVILGADTQHQVESESGHRATSLTNTNVTPELSGDNTHSILLPSSQSNSQPTVAVLPIRNLGEEANRVLLGDAISQEVIVELSKVHWLFLIARGSSFRFRENADVVEAGRSLGARYILTGTVELNSKQCLLTVEFADAPNAKVIWAERYECAKADLMSLRNSVCAGIVGQIENRVQLAEAARVAALPTENLNAWETYHRGLSHMYRFTAKDNAVALHLFERAAKLDPGFSRAYSGLSFTHFQNAFLHLSDNHKEQVSQSKKYAELAHACDPYDPFANLTMGRSCWLDNRLEEARSWLDRSLKLSPNYAMASYNRALVDVLLNDGLSSETHVSRAMSLSPLDPLSYAMSSTRGMSHLVRGDYDTACDWATKATMEPGAHVHIYLIAALSLELAGHRESALKQIKRVKSLVPDYTTNDFLRAFQYRDPDTVNTISVALAKLLQ